LTCAQFFVMRRRFSFFVDFEEGHLFPALTLAEKLTSCGSEVIFHSPEDNRDYVEERGISFAPLFPKIYPKGYKRKYRALKQENPFGYADTALRKQHMEDIVAGALDRVLINEDEHTAIFSVFYAFEALLSHMRYGIRPLIFTPFLKADPSSKLSTDLINHVNAQPLLLRSYMQSIPKRFATTESYSLSDFAKRLDDFPELIAAAPFMADNELSLNPNQHFIGLCLGQPPRISDARLLNMICRGKPVIYCCFGSQTAAYREKAKALYKTVLSGIEQFASDKYTLIVAAGDLAVELRREVASDLICIVDWIDQRQVLQSTSCAIIHGGAGTYKECISALVPMLVIPFLFDQPLNARRIRANRFGISLHNSEFTPATVFKVVEELLNNDRYFKALTAANAASKLWDSAKIVKQVISI
jgi:zeaxanthin glucosyltransferase